MRLQSLRLSRSRQRTDKVTWKQETTGHSGHHLLGWIDKNPIEKQTHQQAKLRELWLHDKQQNLQGLHLAWRIEQKQT